jgi:hypothetical protein
MSKPNLTHVIQDLRADPKSVLGLRFRRRLLHFASLLCSGIATARRQQDLLYPHSYVRSWQHASLDLAARCFHLAAYAVYVRRPRSR